MKAKTVFFCTECGSESPRWSGRCTVCGAWNSMVEQAAERPSKNSKMSRVKVPVKVSRITDMQADEEIRFSTGMGELDRVLGGGAVKGSLVLVGGAPGIGKSTLMLQICQQLGKFAKVLYVSGEESTRQLKLRAERLRVDSENLFVLSETRLGDVLECVQQEQPDILIVDSIQTLYNEELDSPAGGVGQVKDCTMALMQLAKGQEITVFVIGHVNKEGSIAGPKVLEHMVDCVLYFEGDRHMTYRILRAAKNRFGATNEIGVFEMLDAGLREVENPSEMLLSGRPADASGTCVTCVMEGARPVLAEVQALLAPCAGARPMRSSNGLHAAGGTGKARQPEGEPVRRLSEHHRRTDAGRAGGGSGGGGGYCVQLSGQAGARHHGGGRGGRTFRRDTQHHPHGTTPVGSKAFRLYTMHGASSQGQRSEGTRWFGASSGGEYLPGVAAAGSGTIGT